MSPSSNKLKPQLDQDADPTTMVENSHSKSWFDKLAIDRKDRGGEQVDLRVSKYVLSRLPMVGYANDSN